MLMDWRNASILACAIALVVGVFAVKWSARRLPPENAHNPGAVMGSSSGDSEQRNPASSAHHGEIGMPATPRRVDAPETARSAPSTSLTLQAQLLPPDFERDEFLAEGRIGIAEISDEDFAETISWLENGQEGSGPQSAAELANVRRWIPVTVKPDERGGGVLGPIEIPPAFSYRILAWLDDGSFYWKEYQPTEADATTTTLDAGEIALTEPTGLYLRLINNTPGEASYVAHIERIVDPADAQRSSSFQPVIQQVAPRMADALLDGDGVIVDTGTPTRLAPLLPDPGLTITLSTAAGVAAKPLYVQLQEGVVKTVDLDLSRLFARATTDTLRLVGKLYASQTSTPLAGVVIERTGAHLPATQVTAEDGGFVFDGIPRSQVSRFTARTTVTSGIRPMGPAHREFVFDPDLCEGATTGSECAVEWCMPLYHWLVAAVPEDERDMLSESCVEPYPIYFLQKRSESGLWIDVASDQFLMEKDGVAISVTADGTYRVALAHSPVRVEYSEPMHMARTDLERFARLVVPEHPPENRSFRIVSGRNRTPVSGASVEIHGPHGSLPPMFVRTSSDGMVDLGPATEGRVTVTVGLAGSEPVSHEMPLQPGMEIEI